MSSNKKNRKYRFHYYIVLLVHAIFIFSCAQITAPTGGERDTKAPTITRSTPSNYSTNFNQKDINIAFDEWIQPLSNPKTQVIISPDIVPFPDIEIARNDLKIHFKEALLPNTTYSIFFGDNIKDNHEGNPFPNYKYIFSTGKYIDSIKVKGSLKTGLDKIPDNTYLLLYKETEDSAFLKNRPFYITKVQADGSFNLENVKEGNYKIYALSDKNANYYYDLPTEAIGFTDSISRINADLDTLTFELFLPEESKLRILEFDRIVKGGILNILFNKELSLIQDDITVAVLENQGISPIAFQEKEAKKLSVYFPKLANDTNKLTLIIKNNQTLVDTLEIRTESKNYTKPVVFFNDTSSYKSLGIFETQSLTLIASYYSLSSIDTAKIILKDSSNNTIFFTITRIEDLQTYKIRADWKAGMQYHLQFNDSALVDLVGNYNKNQEFSFLVRSLKKAGNLLINYELPQKGSNYIAILKENSGKVLDKQILRDSQRVQINYGLMPAGNYLVEVIDDKNKNGIWNSGSFTSKILPEKIYKEIKPVLVKENWDAEETIVVDFKKITNPSKTNTNPAAEEQKPFLNNIPQKDKNNGFIKE